MHILIWYVRLISNLTRSLWTHVLNARMHKMAKDCTKINAQSFVWWHTQWYRRLSCHRPRYRNKPKYDIYILQDKRSFLSNHDTTQYHIGTTLSSSNTLVPIYWFWLSYVVKGNVLLNDSVNNNICLWIFTYISAHTVWRQTQNMGRHPHTTHISAHTAVRTDMYNPPPPRDHVK